MEVIFILPSLSGYIDRAKLIFALSNHVERLYFLVGKNDINLDTDSFPNLRLVDLKFKPGRRIVNVMKASLKTFILCRKDEQTIIHDTFGNLLPLFWMKKLLPQAKFLTSFYIINGWRIRHVWRTLPLYQKLTSRHTAQNFYNAWVQRQLSIFSDCIVLQASEIIEQLRQVLPKLDMNKCAVLPNNIDVDFWSPPAEIKRKKDEQRLRLLFVGGLDRTRGIFHLLEMMELLHARSVNATLTMVGKWSPHDKSTFLSFLGNSVSKENIKILPKVSREKLREMFNSHDIFVYQSNNDGSPRIVLEALACGLPVVASTHPGIKILDPKKEFIAFNEFGNVKQIVEHVIKFANNDGLRQNVSQYGSQSVHSNFSTKIIALNYLRLYQGIVS